MMKSGIMHYPFTMAQGQFPRMIVSPIEIRNPRAFSHGSISKMRSIAQWDTGADFCMISSELAKNLHLEPSGEASINQVLGEDLKRNSYLVDLALPNQVYFNEVVAIEDPGLKSTGVDFLVGLDVINVIDFALTHDKNGGTVLSISYPGDRLIDFSER